MISQRSVIGWTTCGHTGEDLFLYAYGPIRPAGTIDNTELALFPANGMGIDLNAADAKLFVEANKLFVGATTYIDKSDTANPVLIIEKGLFKAKLPANKNIIEIGNQIYQMNGLTIYVPDTDRVYVLQQALELAKAAGLN